MDTIRKLLIGNSASSIISFGGGKLNGTAGDSTTTSAAAGGFGGGRNGTRHDENDLMNHVTPEMADRLLNDTMNRLSIQERQEAYEDVHGVRFAGASSSSSSPAPPYSAADATAARSESAVYANLGPSAWANAIGNESNIQDLLRAMDEALESLSHSWKQEEEKKKKWKGQSNGDIHESSRSAWEIAMTQNEPFIKSMRIWFLRCELYDTKKAAFRMMGFLEFKRQFFDEELLGVDIQIRHLSKEDLEYLQTGCRQILPERDNCGRIVIFAHSGTTQEEKILLDSYYSVASKIRIQIYLACIVAKRINGENDAVSALKGTVSIGYLSGGSQLTTSNRMTVWYSCQLNSVVPFRTTSIHICFAKQRDDPVLSTAFAMIQTALGNSSLIRTRVHYGRHIEVVYNLMTFGILPDSLPFSRDTAKEISDLDAYCDGVVVSSGDHIRFLKEQHLIEQQARARKGDRNFCLPNDSPKESPTTLPTASPEATTKEEKKESLCPAGEVVVRPTEIDVILGRGTNPRNYPGNHLLHTLIEKYAEQYESASTSRFEKTVIASTIVEQIKNYHSKDSGNSCPRFLRRHPESGNWIVVSHQYARGRVAHAFRNRRKQQPQQKQTNRVVDTGRSASATLTNKIGNDKGLSMLSVPLSSTPLCYDGVRLAELLPSGNKRHKSS